MKIFLPLLLALTLSSNALGADKFPNIRFQGMERFILGVWDTRWSTNERLEEEFFPKIFEAGVNTVCLELPEKMIAPDKLATLKALNVNYPNVSVIVFLRIEPFLKGRDALPEAEREEKQKLLVQVVEEFKQHLNVIGYSFDEPENRISIRESGTTVAEWLSKNLRWVFETIKKTDPDALLMTNVAWGPTYQDVPYMYDVLMANAYPEFNPEQNEFAILAADARVAAKAVRENRKHSFIYCPGCFDNLMPGKYVWTESDLRYLYYAPICHGAGGLMAWRLRYATAEYAQDSILPLIKEIAGLSDYWLGDDASDQFASGRDARNKTSFRIEYRADWIEYCDAGPECMWTARRHTHDESVLLLAVNNLQTDINVGFTIPPEYTGASRYPSGEKITIKDGQFMLDFTGQEVVNIILTKS